VNRRAFISTFAGGLLAAPLAAGAQQATKIPRIGYLSAASAESDKNRFAHFRRGMQELGYIEGKNIVIEQRYGQLEKIPELPAELISKSMSS
jgi:putative ABC transport system substrate-binding protein